MAIARRRGTSAGISQLPPPCEALAGQPGILLGLTSNPRPFTILAPVFRGRWPRYRTASSSGTSAGAAVLDVGCRLVRWSHEGSVRRSQNKLDPKLRNRGHACDGIVVNPPRNERGGPSVHHCIVSGSSSLGTSVLESKKTAVARIKIEQGRTKLLY